MESWERTHGWDEYGIRMITAKRDCTAMMQVLEMRGGHLRGAATAEVERWAHRNGRPGIRKASMTTAAVEEAVAAR